ncbi:MAG: hypothetical protein KF863_05625 [Rubrivivax sp.]|nr:hypothetical protein [Rubrivivax sp.]
MAASSTPTSPLAQEHGHAPAPGAPAAAARLYVVQLGAGAGCRGQVEHVLSGRRQAFATADELLAALGLAARTTAA